MGVTVRTRPRNDLRQMLATAGIGDLEMELDTDSSAKRAAGLRLDGHGLRRPLAFVPGEIGCFVLHGPIGSFFPDGPRLDA